MTAFKRGDKVQEFEGGPTMEVLAASDTLAICEYDDNGLMRHSIFEVAKLRKLVVQQAQQPQPPRS
jgi:uncharacterized protein YodC (DUF2158 family)